MDNKYINIYNILVILTRNKSLYDEYTKEDTFSDRLIFFLFHFAFFLKVFKNKCSKKILQDLFDYIFKQLEFSIREEGHGDITINKMMKKYINFFYALLTKIDKWEKLSKNEKEKICIKYLNFNKKNSKLLNYFNKYLNYLEKNSFNSLIKGVIKPNF